MSLSGKESAKANYHRAMGLRRLLRLGAPVEEAEFLGNWKGATSSNAASENYAEHKLDTLAIAGGHAERPYFLARDVYVEEALIREVMPGLVEQYEPLRQKVSFLTKILTAFLIFTHQH